jgi:TnpA family transposase
MIDVLYRRDRGPRPEIVITDTPGCGTPGYSDIVFALLSLLGMRYQPQPADLPDQSGAGSRRAGRGGARAGRRSWS